MSRSSLFPFVFGRFVVFGFGLGPLPLVNLGTLGEERHDLLFEELGFEGVTLRLLVVRAHLGDVLAGLVGDLLELGVEVGFADFDAFLEAWGEEARALSDETVLTYPGIRTINGEYLMREITFK